MALQRRLFFVVGFVFEEASLVPNYRVDDLEISLLLILFIFKKFQDLLEYSGQPLSEGSTKI